MLLFQVWPFSVIEFVNYSCSISLIQLIKNMPKDKTHTSWVWEFFTPINEKKASANSARKIFPNLETLQIWQVTSGPNTQKKSFLRTRVASLREKNSWYQKIDILKTISILVQNTHLSIFSDKILVLKNTRLSTRFFRRKLCKTQCQNTFPRIFYVQRHWSFKDTPFHRQDSKCIFYYSASSR